MTKFDVDCFENINAGNKSEGLLYLTKWAEKGSLSAQIKLGDYYLDSCSEGARDEGIKWYQTAANSDCDAAFLLAGIYEKQAGNGQVSKVSDMILWYEKASALGSKEAMYSLATLYELGDYVNKNIDIAIEWYKKAIELNDIDSAVSLAELYIEEKDEPVKAQAVLKGFIGLRRDVDLLILKIYKESGIGDNDDVQSISQGIHNEAKELLNNKAVVIGLLIPVVLVMLVLYLFYEIIF